MTILLFFGSIILYLNFSVNENKNALGSHSDVYFPSFLQEEFLKPPNIFPKLFLTMQRVGPLSDIFGNNVLTFRPSILYLKRSYID